MLSIGGVTFLNPWALGAVALLPLVWLLLRLLPPAPKRVLFPPVRLLLGLGADETASSRTPPWLTALRLGLLVVLIGATAHPVLNVRDTAHGGGPMVIVVDTGWAAARSWTDRRVALLGWIDRAARQNRSVMVVETAEVAGAPAPVNVVSPAEARRQARAMEPKPWGTDRAAALARLAKPDPAQVGNTVWLSDGLAEPGGEAATDAWMATLRQYGPLTVVRPRDRRGLVTLEPARGDGAALSVRSRRADGAAAQAYYVVALAEDGTAMARVPLSYAAGELTATATLDLPAELRERASMVRLEEGDSAASVALLDDRWRRRAVGLVGDADTAPLLGGLYYLRRALSPFAEVRVEKLAALLSRPPSVMMLADPPAPSSAQTDALKKWMRGGGVLVRFAGPRLAKNSKDLVPVPLRQGGRALGGALSWGKPVGLGAFPDNGPFKGLAVAKDVRVRRQVLAQPTPDLADATWARLADGTPLVTASRQGDGWLVLVHTTANAAWSDLALSGVFVEMLERLVLLGRSGAEDGGGVLSPMHLLDGYGRWSDRMDDGIGIDAAAMSRAQVGPRHPPGLYGRGSYRRALNVGPSVGAMVPLGSLPEGVQRAHFGEGGETGLRPALLMAALLFALMDAVAALVLRGVIVGPGRWGRTVGGAGVLAVLAAQAVAAGAPPPASLETRLAHISTGSAETDQLVTAGLRGLSVMVNRRTAVSLAEPVMVDVHADDLSLYPLLYWPVTTGASLPDDDAATRIANYLAHGGVVLFDTGVETGGDTPQQSLRDLAKALRLPSLVAVNANHVLGRSFYLLHRFPGRWDNGAVWVERADERVNDGVSGVIAGGNGWAAAWAMDDTQRFTVPVVPGGEAQREQALRFGINVVMYVLTGNYKSDQVHVRSILERLKQ